MKKIITVALFIAILAAVSLSGCTIPIGGQSSPTPTVIYGPVPSALPTPAPTPVPGSAIANSKPSDALKIITSPLDYKVVTDQKTRDGRQFENITLMVMNTGTETAPKVMLAVTIIDETNLNTLIYQEFDIGDLSRGEQKMVSLVTDPHNPSNYIKVTISMHWGYSNEYYSTTPFAKTFTFML